MISEINQNIETSALLLDDSMQNYVYDFLKRSLHNIFHKTCNCLAEPPH